MPRRKVGIANLSLPKGLLINGSPRDHQEYVNSIDADGLEVAPMSASRLSRIALQRGEEKEKKARRPAGFHSSAPEARDFWMDVGRDKEIEREARMRKVDAALGDLVLSQHQSFVGYGGGGLLDAIVRRAFPTGKESLRWMKAMQHIIGPRPAVLYEAFDGERMAYDDENAPFPSRRFQPTPHGFAHMGLHEDSEIEEITAVMDEAGLGEIAFDGFHARKFRDPVALAAKLAKAGRVKEMHASVHRLDMTGLHSDDAKQTRAERRALVRSAEAFMRTQQGEIMGAVTEEWNRQDQAQPGNAQEYLTVLEEGPLRAGLSTQSDHFSMIANLRQIVGVPYPALDS